MTLCSLVFDLLVVLGMYAVKKTSLDASTSDGISDKMLHDMLGRKWAEAAKFLSKSGGLAVSTAWVIKDLVAVSTAAPGQGTLILGSITAAASFLVLLAELCAWIILLPKAVERFTRVLQEGSPIQATATVDFQDAV